MKVIQEETVLNFLLKEALDREQHLIKKYDDYYGHTEEKELKDAIKEFKTQSDEHINAIKDKIMKLHINY